VNVIADVCVIPLGGDSSLSGYIAACEKIFAEAGLETHLHAYGTNVEGEWDAVMNAIKRCHETVHQMGAPRISTSIKVGTRTDKAQSMNDKVRSVNAKLSAG